jgi:hypothetical protein
LDACVQGGLISYSGINVFPFCSWDQADKRTFWEKASCTLSKCGQVIEHI